MYVLYSIGIRLYYILVLLASPFNTKASHWIRGRRRLFKHIRKEFKTKNPVAWFHAASLGEFEQGRPLIEALRKKRPELCIVLTFFSPSGYEVQKDYPGADFIYYLPLDTRKNAITFIKLIKPELVVFVKYEFWYHFLTEVKNFGAQLILISSIFRPGQLFFKKRGSWYRSMLSYFNHIFVQDEKSMNLLANLNLTNVSIAGDTRFDRVAQIAAESNAIDIAEHFTKNRKAFVFGSTWEKDEQLITQYINSSNSDTCFILAPHEINETHIKQLMSGLHKQVVRYSMLNTGDLQDAKVLIIDNIGMLSALYRYGCVAYIGGGFGKGIHNVLEPAVYGMPVIFGPNYSKFKEAVDLVSEGGAFSINDFNKLKEKLDLFQNSKKELSHASRATKSFVQRNLGATHVILKYLTNS